MKWSTNDLGHTHQGTHVYTVYADVLWGPSGTYTLIEAGVAAKKCERRGNGKAVAAQPRLGMLD